jgi:hypothetical protein
MKSPKEEVEGEFLWRKEPRKRCASAAAHDEESFTVTDLCFVNKSTSGVPFNGDYEKD